MKKLLLATALMTTAAMSQAAVINVSGTLDGTINGSGATVSYTPGAPSFTGTYDTVSGDLDFLFEDYTMNIQLAFFSWDVDMAITASNMIGVAGDAMGSTNGGIPFNY